MESPIASEDRSKQRRQALRSILRFHSAPEALAEYDVGVPVIVSKLSHSINQALCDDLRNLAMVWAQEGELFDAVELLNSVNVSTEVLYEIARDRGRANFGETYDEYKLICKYGTVAEIDRAAVLCRTCNMPNLPVPHGWARDVICETYMRLEAVFGKNMKIHGQELSKTHDVINDYDAIVGIANAGVAVPRIASVLGHKNTGIIEYHRDWGDKDAQWLMPADIASAKTVLLCDNDAVTGQTISRALLLMLNSNKNAIVDILFTGGCFDDKSVSALSGMGGIRRALCINEFAKKNVFSRVLELHGLLEKRIALMKSG